MRASIAAFAAGLLFGLGLLLAGMTQPAKVQGFLDFAGAWDPSLAFVMAGAIAVHLPLARWIRSRRRPLFEPAFDLPGRKGIDGRLLAGAAIFGIGWGLGGFCPGPAIVSVAGGELGVLVFVAAMVAGMGIQRALDCALSRQPQARPPLEALDA